MATRLKKQRPSYPIFDMYTIEQLSKLLPYAESTLLDVKEGRYLHMDRFVRIARGILNRSEAELFGGDSDG